MDDNVISLFGERQSTPELSAKVLGEVLRIVAVANASILANTVFEMVIQNLAVKEEECSTEIFRAIFFLAQAGVIDSDGFKTDEMSFSVDTVLIASTKLKQYIS